MFVFVQQFWWMPLHCICELWQKLSQIFESNKMLKMSVTCWKGHGLTHLDKLMNTKAIKWCKCMPKSTPAQMRHRFHFLILGLSKMRHIY